MVRTLALTAVLATALAAAGCSKSAGNQETAAAPAGADTSIPTPHGPGMKGAAMDPPGGGGAPVGMARDRLHPDEGTLAITPPTAMKSGTEVIATIRVTPATGYHVNTVYPIKLTLTAPAGVTLAKTELNAGGHDGAAGDAAELTEQSLRFDLKVTAAAAGNYTLSGNFKFAVCDHDSCLPKTEPIAIAVAAN